MATWHNNESAKPAVAKARDFLARIEAALSHNPVNASRFRKFRAELRTALAESESYLRWTLSDWSGAIEFELDCIEQRFGKLAA